MEMDQSVPVRLLVENLGWGWRTRRRTTTIPTMRMGG